MQMAFLTALLAIFALVAARGNAPAATPTPKSAFEQQWAALIAAARAEGRLSVAAGGAPSREYAPLLRYFSQKFGVKAEMTTGPANQTITKVLAERGAKRYTFDIAMLHPNATNTQLMPAHAIDPVLEPIVPLLFHPEVMDMSKWSGKRFYWGDKFQQYILIYAIQIEPKQPFLYNGKKISDKEAATITDPWDYFDPKWKGLLANPSFDEATSFVIMTEAYWAPNMGPDWIRKFADPKTDVAFTNNRTLLDSWLVQGTRPLRPLQSMTAELRQLQKAGAPIKEGGIPRKQPLLTPGGSGCCVSVFNRPAHPNAAKLFINWFLSREGQAQVHAVAPVLDRASLRLDIPPGNAEIRHIPDPKVEYTFPEADPDSAARIVEARAFLTKLWEAR
jgi:iron(III) transport system substrate-binding protein